MPHRATPSSPAAEGPVGGAADCDVLVCGLGPVGQLLALLLGRAGVKVTAIDQAPEPFDLPRAAVVDDEVLRIFQSAGVDERIRADSQVQEEVSFVTEAGRPTGTFLSAAVVTPAGRMARYQSYFTTSFELIDWAPERPSGGNA